MKSTFLSKRDTALLVKRIEASWPTNIVPKMKTIKEYQVDGDESFYKTDEFTAVQVGKEKVHCSLSWRHLAPGSIPFNYGRYGSRSLCLQWSKGDKTWNYGI